MMLVTNSYPNGVHMPGGGPPSLAMLLFAALEPDKLYLQSQVLARLNRAGCVDPVASLKAALAAGWLMQEACGSIGYASRCWLSMHRPNGEQASASSSLVSFFKPPITNVIPYKDVTLADIHRLISGPYLSAQTQRLRSLPIGSQERQQLKMCLEVVQ